MNENQSGLMGDNLPEEMGNGGGGDLAVLNDNHAGPLGDGGVLNDVHPEQMDGGGGRELQDMSIDSATSSPRSQPTPR